MTWIQTEPDDLFFFFKITRPPQKSPLFPYTPLSRSPVVVHHEEAAETRRDDGQDDQGFPAHDRELLLATAAHHDEDAADHHGAGQHEQRQPEHGDRKSTRLNSSHSQISYAVFCLKKK